jgi:hypothetical protein
MILLFLCHSISFSTVILNGDGYAIKFFDFAFMITPHYDLCEAISAFLLDYLNTSCWSLCTWSSSSLCCPI